jgi:hypothetical protein
MRVPSANICSSIGVLALALLTGCASTSPAPQGVEPAGVTGASEQDPSLKLFTRATELLDSNESAPNSPLRIGDQVLLGLVVRSGETTRVRYLRLSVTEELPGFLFYTFDAKIGQATKPLQFASMIIMARTELFDQDARLMADSSSKAPSTLLGLLPTALQVLSDYQIDLSAPPNAHARQFTDQDSETYVFGMGSLLIFSGYLGDRLASPLTDIMWEVVDRPSLMSIAFSGISVSIAPNGRVRESTLAPGAKVMRLLMDINDRPALVADITAVPRSRPLALASSIIAVDATSPTDPSRTLTVRVLGTRLGPTPAPTRTPPDEPVAAAPAR